MDCVLHDDFDIRFVASELSIVGGVSVPILSDETRELLLNEALSYPYERRESIVGPARVRQDLFGVDALPLGSPFFLLRDRFQSVFAAKLAEHPDGERLFRTPLNFDELSLQRYEAGSFGISPHRDGRSRINLVCVFTLTGVARFCLCDDRSGKNPIALNAAPGTVILLRAPGFRGSEHRPFHFVTDVRELRMTFGLRQRG